VGKRKISILEPAATSVAEIAMFIESKGLPMKAKKFVDEAFAFFEKLSDDRITHHPIRGNGWTTDVLLIKRNML
jgi:hypothetical protein